MGTGRLLVIGDLILDIYHYGDRLKASAEGASSFEEKFMEVSYGGAGLVVRNILHLGGRATFLSRIGKDDFGRHLQEFSHKNLKKIFIGESGRKTTVKERFVAAGEKLLKWNHLDNRELAGASERRIVNFLRRNLKSFDKLVVSDYRHGLLTKSLAKKIVQIAKQSRIPVYLDSQVSQKQANHSWYKGADLICLNQLEAASLDKKFIPRNLKQSLKRLSHLLQSPNVILKLGEKGSAALCGGSYIETPAAKVKTVDATGAGDAFYAVLSLLNFPPSRAQLRLANHWAALTTTKIGTQLPPKISL